jgi:hypothetical protein
MPRKMLPVPDSTNILDYPSNLSVEEKEDLVAKAILKAERGKKRLPQIRRPKPKQRTR